MARPRSDREHHLVSRVGWLRAAVLGANDGLLSTSSLILGVAAAAARPADILIAGAAALVAGAMSMAAGEYVSVSSQADTEKADLAREAAELHGDLAGEHRELAALYVARGLDAETAAKVADQLMARDALGAHARDELGITSTSTPRPIQAALASAASFTAGAAPPLLVTALTPSRFLIPAIAGASLAALAILGAVGAEVGGAAPWRAAARVTFWGALAMAVTAGVGHLVGRAI